jgi:hypothetical protein
MGLWRYNPLDVDLYNLLGIDLFAEATSSVTGESLGVSWFALIVVATVVMLVPLVGVRQLLKLRAEIQRPQGRGHGARPRHVVGPLERRLVRVLFGPQPGDG